jgi:hypothetical protein
MIVSNRLSQFTVAFAFIFLLLADVSAFAQVNPQTGEAKVDTPGPILPPRTPWYKRPGTQTETAKTTPWGQGTGQGNQTSGQQTGTQSGGQQTTTPGRDARRPAGKPLPSGQYASETEARVRCVGGVVVWANTDSKIYHYAGSPWYGKTKKGAYMCERDTTSAGIRAAKNQTRPAS